MVFCICPNADAWQCASCAPMDTWRDFCVVMSPTMVVQPLTVRMGSRSIPMIKLLIGMCFTATWSHPPVHPKPNVSWRRIDHTLRTAPTDTSMCHQESEQMPRHSMAECQCHCVLVLAQMSRLMHGCELTRSCTQVEQGLAAFQEVVLAVQLDQFESSTRAVPTIQSVSCCQHG